jgi:hypothetical protein
MGAEDLLLREAPACDASLALAFVARLATASDGEPIDWPALTLTDFDAVLLMLRRSILGDLIRAEAACPGPSCGQRVDVTFSLHEYVAVHVPRPPRRVTAMNETGWFCWRGHASNGVSFRLPCVADRLAVADHPDPVGALINRCVRPQNVSQAQLRRVEGAMEALAPSLSGILQGECPE